MEISFIMEHFLRGIVRPIVHVHATLLTRLSDRATWHRHRPVAPAPRRPTHAPEGTPERTAERARIFGEAWGLTSNPRRFCLADSSFVTIMHKM